MTRDERVQLSERIEALLVGMIPSEWGRWMSYCKAKGLEKAIQFAKNLSTSKSLRSGPQQSYKTIYEVILKFKTDLEKLSPKEILEVLGYVSWNIHARKTFKSTD